MGKPAKVFKAGSGATLLNRGGNPVRLDVLKGQKFYFILEGVSGIISLPPPPDPPFDIETMEPLDVPTNWGWSDEGGPPPEEWWHETQTN